MNPVLIIITFILLFLFWLICSFLYTPIGKFFKRLWDDAGEAMGLTDKNKENK